MKGMAENSLKMITKFGESIAGGTLSHGVARLYSHHTRLRSGAKGLSSWTEGELFNRLAEGERLLIAGLTAAENATCQRYLRRAGEIFEWAATSMPSETPVPVVLLAASAYQLAGYSARASGVLSEHPLPDSTSKILTALLRADFPEAQRLLLEIWDLKPANGVTETSFDKALLDQLLRALGVMVAWFRWGDDPRIDIALTTIKKISNALRYDNDHFSWLLCELFAAIGYGYKRDALWTVLSPLLSMVTGDGRRAFDRYAKVAFLERKLLAWPSQQAGICGIVSEGSFALCTPTGSGKTRVAELVILRHLFRCIDDVPTNNVPLVLYLAPSRALSAEVEVSLSRALRNIRATTVTVTSLYGGNDFGPSDLVNIGEQPTVLISTHEKADVLIRFLGANMLRQISCVIIDEAHTVSFTGNYEDLSNAKSRSLRLENLVNRLKTFCASDTTFVALSAVAAEIKDILSVWVTGNIHSHAIAPDYRSTRQLFGQLRCAENGATTIRYDVLDGQRLSVEDQDSVPYVPNPFPSHPPTPNAFAHKDSTEKRMRAHLLWAAMHFAQISEGRRHSVLISVTEHPEWYAETFLNLLTGDWYSCACPDYFAFPREEFDQKLFSRCLESCADYFGYESRECRLLKMGIVLHHGKMPAVMSRLLIELIRSHIVNIVIATSTLSEGVNLPFETVLIPSLRRGGDVANAKEIINVAGRAGRPGVSTEGKTLVLLPLTARRSSNHAYNNIVNSMTMQLPPKNEGIHSPLYALIVRIEQLWRGLSKSCSREEFIAWLETASYSMVEGKNRLLLTSLDTLDQHLLDGIEEMDKLNTGSDVEKALQSLWQNSLASKYENNSRDEYESGQYFVCRGRALIKTIYPEREQRKKLYNTGLPPRDGIALIDMLPEIKVMFQKAVDYCKWDNSERIQHFIELIEMTSQISAFKIQNHSKKVKWSDVFIWWMAPDIAENKPSVKAISSWYSFASKHFIYGLNWALGSVIGALLEQFGAEGTILDRWQRCGLPWSVLWYKDMVSWGTLDPVASYILARKEVFTRSDAKNIAAEYWASIDSIMDADLDPRLVSEWITRKTPLNIVVSAQPAETYEMKVELLEDCSSCRERKFRVLPVLSDENNINWYDPAGYILAKSKIPDHWNSKESAKYDFILNPMSLMVTWRQYL